MSTGEQSLFFLFNVNGPSTGSRFYFWQIKSLFHGPTFWLQKTESFNKKNSLTLQYLYVVTKEDPRAQTVDGRVVHGGSQL